MAKTDVILVNADKEIRAKDLVALAKGERSPRNSREADVSSFWADKLKTEQPKDPVLFVYEQLGGLVRTHAEEKAARARKEQIKAKTRKGGKGKK